MALGLVKMGFDFTLNITHSQPDQGWMIKDNDHGKWLMTLQKDKARSKEERRWN